MMRSLLTCTVLVPLLAGCVVDAARQTSGAGQQPVNLPFQVQVVADFESPWAMTFLPDGRMLITEKSGILYVVSADGQQRKRVDGIPVVSSEGQGGLMDVVLHPGFTKNRLVYVSYAEAGQGGKGVVLARGLFADGEQPVLQKVETLFRATPYVDGDGHYSGRIAFSPDGYLFFTNGEHQKFEPAQIRKRRWGKFSASRTTESRRPTIRWSPKDSIRRSGPTAIATCSALRSMRAATSGNRKWVPRAVTK
jgi:aldose sugar dehydrogenase